MMNSGDKVTKVKGTPDAWDSRELGADRKFVKVASPETTSEVDTALGLQSISIRLDKNLIDSFKLIGSYHGIGYQPLMRDALKRFADCELKAIVSGVVETQKKTHPNGHTPTKPKKAA